MGFLIKDMIFAVFSYCERKFFIPYLRPHLNNNSQNFLFLPCRSGVALAVHQSCTGIYPSPRGRNVVKQPGLGLHYLAKLWSFFLPIGPSAAAIWQESLKANFWQRDKAEEECPSDNTENIFLRSQGRLKDRELLTASEKLKLSVPCQELTDSNGETPKVTSEDSLSRSLSPSCWF